VPTNGVEALSTKGSADSELVDRAHVTRLQVEVERLNSELTLHHSRCGGAYSAVLKQNETLQAELTKARELIGYVQGAIQGGPEHPWIPGGKGAEELQRRVQDYQSAKVQP
jgi:hypothetical protein